MDLKQQGSWGILTQLLNNEIGAFLRTYSVIGNMSF